ncbi:GGDEF domain [Comamonadaceae bacterium]
MGDTKVRVTGWLLCALLAIAGGEAFAVLPQWAQTRLESVGVGAIPRGVVATAVQDATGYLWLATGDGLVRYDGYRFTSQETADPDPVARNLGWIRALHAGKDGKVWIGTETRGLAVYDPVIDSVQVLGNAPSSTQAGQANKHSTVRALAEDREGGIWVGSLGTGLARLDPATKAFKSYRKSSTDHSLPDDRVQALLVDTNGDLWVGTWTGLSRKRHTRDRFERIDGVGAALSLKGRTVQALMQDNAGLIWAGTLQGDIARIDPKTGSVEMLSNKDLTQGAGAVTSFVQSSDGTVWVGRDSGIEVRDSTSAKVLKQLQHDPARPDGLAANEVTTLLRAQDGWLWIAGFGVGLQRHDPGNTAILLRNPQSEPRDALAKPDVRGLLQLANGDIWAATHTAGIGVLSSDLQSKGTFALPGAGNRQAPLQVGAMAQMPDGSVWVAGAGALHRVSEKGQLLSRLALEAGTVHRLVAGSDGRLWVCTQDGLLQVPPDGRSVLPVHLQGGSKLKGDAFTVAQGPDQALWVGTSQGIFRIPAHSNEMVSVAAEPGGELGTPVVIGLLWDRANRLWVDTAVSGLHKLESWNGTAARFDRVSQRHGFVSRPFGANLMEDAQGRIWTQMHVYDPQADSMLMLSAVDGIDIGTPWFFSFTKTQNGRLLFGGSKGLLVVSPETFQASQFSPPLVLTQIRVNNARWLMPPMGEALRIAPGQNNFTFDFAALDLAEPGRLRYAYRLEGFDPDWVQTGPELRSASYGSLSPGSYVMRIRATNRHGQWSSHELAVPVTVEAAWWQHTSVAVAALVALIAAMYGVIQLRTRQLRVQHLILESKVQERTQALEEASLTDPLTGMRNRRFLSRHIESDIDLVARRYSGYAKYGAEMPKDADLIFYLIDIDHFKALNDEFGHAAGDAVLMQLRERFSTVFRDTDYMVRWGGEEFLIVARATDRSHALQLGERVRLAVANAPFALEGGAPIYKTCSVGFACFPLCPTRPSLLDWSKTINVADAALYVAKSRGRNACVGIKDTGHLNDSEILEKLQDMQYFDGTSFTVERTA